ncbi:hypothetical protein M9Y10_034745 [Tritrichomonas musculus]|uniref:Ribosome biogenesis protein NOP53 n=1 Tax=Tritrichomonas musculus TaxID=1915356 RepID=A0ABR2KFS0_9EUKA
MISTTSTPWFVCNPEYNKIDIPDDDDIEIHQQAIDTSDSRSTASDVEFSVNSDKVSNTGEIIDDIPVDTTKEEEIVQPTQNVTLDTPTNGLTEDLELLSTIHFESSKRVQRTEALAQQQRSNVKYTYFSTSDDENEIPSQLQVEPENENETENKNNLSNSVKKSKTSNFTSPVDALSYKFKNYDYIQPISIKKYEELNSMKPIRNPPQEVIKLTRTKVKLPADYMEFNERRRKKDRSQGPTLMSGTSQVKSELTKTKKNTSEQIFENYKKRSPPPPHDPTQERPYFQSYDWKSIENNEPTFVKRPKIDRKQLRKKVESQPLYKERKVKHLPQPEPVPIPHVEKKKIKNVAPTCVKHPEIYTKEYREQKRLEEALKNPPSNSTEVKLEEEDQNEEEKITLPDDKKEKRKCLKQILEETEVEEWKIIEPTQTLPPDDFVNDNEGDEEVNNIAEDIDLGIPEEYLVSDDEPDVNNFVKPKPVYFDPHETKAVRLRNQTIKQKLALRKMQLHLEEEEDDERELKRKIVSREIAPSLKKLEMMSQFRPDDLEDKIRRKEKDNNERAVEPLCAAIRSAKNTQFIVERENKKVQLRSEKNAKKHQNDEKVKRKEEEKLKLKGAKKKKFLDLWKI